MSNKFYDKEALFDSKIAPLLAEITKICKEEHVPMFALFEIKVDEEGPLLVRNYVNGTLLSEMPFSEHVLNTRFSIKNES
jgi:hypothetical protein